MEHAKKMILIEPRVLESMQQQQQQQQQETRQDYDTTSRDLKETDQSMQAILDSDKNIYDKANAYQQALWGFLNRFDQYKDRPLGRVQFTRDSYERNTTKKEEEKEEEESAKPSSPLSWIEQDVVESVPKSFKTKAERLLKRIKLDPEVKWNNLGELEFQGQLIRNSNLTDLVNDVLRQRKNSSDPLGWETFADVLHRLNVPQELIGNPTRWSYMRNPSRKSVFTPTPVKRPLLDDNESFETPPNETPTKWRKKEEARSKRKRKKSIKTDLTWASW